ncbi:MAG: hypothetical protein AB1Z29_08490, partial [Desulfobacterales bacterium]
SAQLAGAAPGLQIRCGALTPSRVGSIPMHFRQTLYCRSRNIRRIRFDPLWICYKECPIDLQ